jgi:hypothetical protein
MSAMDGKPTVVCAWCSLVLHEGTGDRSHGICRRCAARFLAELRKMEPVPIELPAENAELTVV